MKISWINDKVCAEISCLISWICFSQIVRLLSKMTSFFLSAMRKIFNFKLVCSILSHFLAEIKGLLSSVR